MPASTTPTLKSSPADRDDRVGRWFEEFHRVGDHLGMRFARIPRAEDAENARVAPDWQYVPHWRFDGIGAFGQLLREQGFVVDRLPTIKRTERPRLVDWLQAVRRHFGRTRTLQAYQQDVRPWVPPVPEPPRCGNATGWRLFSRAATRELLEHATTRGVSLNSLLLWSADRTARACWLREGWGTTYWMVPVNLRGAVALKRDTANHFGLLDVELTATSTVRDAHEGVRAELERRGHWATWALMQLSGWLPRGALRGLIGREVRSGPFHTGLFSNLGVWGDGPLQLGGEREAAWLFAPQTTRLVPISMGAVLWTGRLALTIQAHPMFGVEDAEVQRWTEAWASTCWDA